MRYVVSYDASQGSADKLRKELARLQADPFHRWAWTLETRLSAMDVLRQLKPFVEAADSLLVVDVTGREVAVAHGPDRTLLAEVGTSDAVPGAITETSLAAASLAAAPDEPALEAPLAAEPGEPTS